MSKICSACCVNTHVQSLKVWLKSVLSLLKYNFCRGLFFFHWRTLYMESTEADCIHRENGLSVYATPRRLSTVIILTHPLSIGPRPQRQAYCNAVWCPSVRLFLRFTVFRLKTQKYVFERALPRTRLGGDWGAYSTLSYLADGFEGFLLQQEGTRKGKVKGTKGREKERRDPEPANPK